MALTTIRPSFQKSVDAPELATPLRKRQSVSSRLTLQITLRNTDAPRAALSIPSLKAGPTTSTVKLISMIAITLGVRQMPSLLFRSRTVPEVSRLSISSLRIGARWPALDLAVHSLRTNSSGSLPMIGTIRISREQALPIIQVFSLHRLLRHKLLRFRRGWASHLLRQLRSTITICPL